MPRVVKHSNIRSEWEFQAGRPTRAISHTIHPSSSVVLSSVDLTTCQEGTLLDQIRLPAEVVLSVLFRATLVKWHGGVETETCPNAFGCRSFLSRPSVKFARRIANVAVVFTFVAGKSFSVCTVCRFRHVWGRGAFNCLEVFGEKNPPLPPPPHTHTHTDTHAIFVNVPTESLSLCNQQAGMTNRCRFLHGAGSSSSA